MKRNLWIVGLVAMLAIAPAAARVDFIPIEGGVGCTPTDITADGSKLLLYCGAGHFFWTASEGLVGIGGQYCSGIPKMSSDGTVVVSSVPDDDGICQAGKWLGGQDWLPMGTEPGGVPCGTLSSAYDTNNDTAVGLFWRPQLCKAIGGTWDLATGTAGPILPSTVPNRPTRGNGITNDGMIVVGWQDDEFGNRNAVRWVNGVQEYILDTDGQVHGEALGVNSTGSVMWGASYRYNGVGQGWLYREGIGFEPMGRGGTGRNIQSPVLMASEDGSVVVGVTRDFDFFIQTGWIWTDKKGWSELNEFLKGQIAAGWNLDTPSVVSADGTIIAGRGFSPEGRTQAFIIDLKAKGPKP